MTRMFFDPARKIGPRSSAALLERGVIGRAMPQGDILGFAPPLCLTASRGRYGHFGRQGRGCRSPGKMSYLRPPSLWGGRSFLFLSIYRRVRSASDQRQSSASMESAAFPFLSVASKPSLLI